MKPIKKLGEQIKKTLKKVYGVDYEPKFVEFEVGYWRKANAIHRWFVDNVQDGEDDCGYYNVSYEKLLELRKVCQDVKDDNSKAEELLPTQEGGFFGGTQYDEWYFKDIDNTIEILDKLLEKMPDYTKPYKDSDGNIRDDNGKIGVDVIYHSSW